MTSPCSSPILCFVDTVDFDTEIGQIEHSRGHIDVFREHSLTVNTVHEHVLKSLEHTPTGGPI